MGYVHKLTPQFSSSSCQQVYPGHMYLSGRMPVFYSFDPSDKGSDGFPHICWPSASVKFGELVDLHTERCV